MKNREDSSSAAIINDDTEQDAGRWALDDVVYDLKESLLGDDSSDMGRKDIFRRANIDMKLKNVNVNRPNKEAIGA